MARWLFALFGAVALADKGGLKAGLKGVEVTPSKVPPKHHKTEAVKKLKDELQEEEGIESEKQAKSIVKALEDAGMEANIDDEILMVEEDASKDDQKQMIVIHKHVEVEPDMDPSDKGAIFKEKELAEENMKQKLQVQGEAIMAGKAIEDLPEVNVKTDKRIEDLTSARKEQLMSGEFLVITVLVLASWFLTEVARHHKLLAIQMPFVCTLMGLVVGILLQASNLTQFLNYLEFNDDIFFMMLLPPIIFESGFKLKVNEIRKSATAILYFAFMGTFFSFLLTGLGMGVLMSIMPFSTKVHITARGVLAFSALISATDPVSVQGLFRDMDIAASFQAIVTGESLMNDAISIALYRTLIQTSTVGPLEAFLDFIRLFAGSILLGMIAGWLTSFIFKYGHSYIPSEMKLSIMVVMSYIAYLMSEFLSCSGIIGILFCGVSQNMYTLPNIDRGTSQAFQLMITTLSHIAESVAFIYLGMATCFLQVSLGDAIAATMVTVISVSVARHLAISMTSQWLKRLHGIIISREMQNGLTMCGLRGAVAFGLAKHARHDFGHGLGTLILAGSLSYAILTVTVVGPCIPMALESLGICKSSQLPTSQYSDEINVSPTARNVPHIVRVMHFIDAKLSQVLLNEESHAESVQSSVYNSPDSTLQYLKEIELTNDEFAVEEASREIVHL